MSHGTITGGTALTRKLAKKHGMSLLHNDLDKIGLSVGGSQLKDWIRKNGVQKMNIAGARASKDVKVYDAVKGVLAIL